jgi:hypothetical protein
LKYSSELRACRKPRGNIGCEKIAFLSSKIGC